MKKQTAKEIAPRLVAVQAELNEVLWVIKRECDEQEFQTCRNTIGKAMGAIVEILLPMFQDHPELEPQEYK